MPDFEPYELAYAKRRGMPAHIIHEYEKLSFAAFLEHQVKVHTLTVSDARRRFIAVHPECNRPMVGRTIIDEKNEYINDNEYEKTSVIWLIQAFDDSIWDIPQL